MDYIYVKATDPKTWDSSGAPTIDGVGVNVVRGVVKIRNTPNHRRMVDHFIQQGKIEEIRDEEEAEDELQKQAITDLQCQATNKVNGQRCKNPAKLDEEGNVLNGYCALPSHQKLAE